MVVWTPFPRLPCVGVVPGPLELCPSRGPIVSEFSDFPNWSLLGPLGREPSLGSRFLVELSVGSDRFRVLQTTKTKLIKIGAVARDTFYGVLPFLFNTWGDMKLMFLEKFFLASRTMTIWKEICGIRQHSGETLHEYWEKFNKLCATCPHHQISEQLLIQYFYEGLMMMDHNMTDVASGGALMDKTLVAARHLIGQATSNNSGLGEPSHLE
ncbi:hypothetical protein CR513_16518, partial [Mucuna pruriens]